MKQLELQISQLNSCVKYPDRFVCFNVINTCKRFDIANIITAIVVLSFD